MAWDFSTEPEFEEKLEWMRGFVREEIFPLETLDLTYDQLLQVIRPLQERVKETGLWAAHLPPALGGMGFGQVKLGLMHEILGQSPLAPVVFGNNAPDSGTRSCWRWVSRRRGMTRSVSAGCSRCWTGSCDPPSR